MFLLNLLSLLLSLLDIEEPTFYLNNSLKPESMWNLTENISLMVSCLVPGNPIPIIRLFNGLNELSSNTSHSRWANHTIISARCEHTGHYTCTGQTEGFDIANKTIAIDVTCKWFQLSNENKELNIYDIKETKKKLLYSHWNATYKKLVIRWLVWYICFVTKLLKC